MESPPMHTLPDEALAMIFSHLSQSDILACVLPVCRRWQAVAQSEVLSRELVFCKDDAVPPEEALRLIQHIPNLKSLQVRRRPDAVQLLLAAGSRCPELRQLRVVDGCKESNVPAALLTLFRSCKQLTDLTLEWIFFADGVQLLGSALPNLQRLTLNSCSWFGAKELDAVLDGCPRIEEFCTTCSFPDAQIYRLVQRWGSSLRVLRLRASELSDAGVAALAGCSQLRSLQVSQLKTPGAGLQQLATLTQLEEFSLLASASLQPNIRDFFSRSRSAGRLRKIRLHCCAGVDDGVLTALASACPGVEDVSVGWCWRVTAAGVRELLRSCRRLVRLDVSERVGNMVRQVLPELPQLAPQLRQLNIDPCRMSRSELAGSIEAQMPDLDISNSYPQIGFEYQK